MLSLVIPIYKSEDNLDRLLAELVSLQPRVSGGMETVFVIDGSLDRCSDILTEQLPQSGIRAQLITLSRNFGSFSAIAAGLANGKGERFAVLAADLQEPTDLVVEFNDIMRRGEADIVFGVRAGRSDPWLAELTSNLFWWVYKKFVVPEMPAGGVDVFGCTRAVRDQLLRLQEVNTNLIALLFWLGYRRQFVRYVRRSRLEGQSAWTFAKRLQYSINSIFNFTDLPIRILLAFGVAGCLLAVITGITVLVCKLLGLIDVPGYTPLILAITFFGGLTALGLGIVGQYLWLTLQNTRGRPNYVVQASDSFNTDAGEGSIRSAAASRSGGGLP